jgi:hypothetical protein
MRSWLFHDLNKSDYHYLSLFSSVLWRIQAFLFVYPLQMRLLLLDYYFSTDI